jgi:hypothetical protein
MRIAVSGTHFMGKSTFIDDFIKAHPVYRCEIEPYYRLQDEKAMELSLEPSLESVLEQLDYSIEQLHDSCDERCVIFDRCPVDFIAYAMCALKEDALDLMDTEVSERFDEIKEALDTLDLIMFIPMTNTHSIEYTEENSMYRNMADACFKTIYRDDLYDIFPRYNHPKIIEVVGDRATRLKMVESYLK